MPTINEVVANNVDDGYEATQAGAHAGSNYTQAYLYAGHVSLPTPDIFYFGGIRFRTVAIDQGVTVNSATLTIFHGTTKTVGSPAPKIYGRNSNNAAVWSSTNRIKDIPKTSNSTNLSVSATSVNDVTAIIQEIVNRAGWVNNNNMAFGIFTTILTGADCFFGGNTKESGNPATLDITYTAVTPVAGDDDSYSIIF